jgi:hypothetical protein
MSTPAKSPPTPPIQLKRLSSKLVLLIYGGQELTLELENGRPKASFDRAINFLSKLGFNLKPEERQELAKQLSAFYTPKSEPKPEGEKKTTEGAKRIVSSLSEEELKKMALELLRSPDLLFKIKTIYEKGVVVDRYRFVLGEGDKKLLVFIIVISAETPYPQSLWVTGDSGYGKTNTVVVTLALMPPGYAKVRSYLTGAGLRYGDQDYKVLFISEWRQFAEQDVRLISREDGSYTYEIAIKDPETGEWTTQVGEIPAKTIITTSAERLPSSQMLRRCLLLSVDEDPELTKKINIRKAEYRAGMVEPASPDEIAAIQHAVSLLQPFEVVIPYAKSLVNLAPWDRTRLDYFLGIISIITCIYQYQREKDEKGRLIATPADLYMAMRICWSTLMQSLQQLPERLKKCLEILPTEDEGLGMTSKEVALLLKKSQSTIRGYLSDLVNLNHAVSDRRQGSREKQFWRVRSRAETAELLNSVESVIQHLKSQNLPPFDKKSSNLPQKESVLNSERGEEEGAGGGEKEEHMPVCDPLTGEEIDLLSLSPLPPPNSTLDKTQVKIASVYQKEVKSGESAAEEGVQQNSTVRQLKLKEGMMTSYPDPPRLKTSVEPKPETAKLSSSSSEWLSCPRCGQMFANMRALESHFAANSSHQEGAQ